MSKEIDEKTKELIELADSSADEKLEAAEKKTDEKVAELREAAGQPAKKKGKGGKIVLAIVGVILALVLAAGGTGLGLLSCATKDEMPAAPGVEPIDMTKFAMNAVTEVVKENTITVDNDVANSLLIKVKDSVNNSTDLIRIDDLFCELVDGKGTLYARVYIDTINVKGIDIKLDKTFPVQADFGVSFDDAQNVVVEIDDIYCGQFKIPAAIVDSVLAQVEFPEQVSLSEDGNILYDTSKLDAAIDEAVANAITSKLDGVLGTIFADFATNLTDVQLTGAAIDGDKIVINGSVF